MTAKKTSSRFSGNVSFGRFGHVGDGRVHARDRRVAQQAHRHVGRGDGVAQDARQAEEEELHNRTTRPSMCIAATPGASSVVPRHTPAPACPAAREAARLTLPPRARPPAGAAAGCTTYSAPDASGAAPHAVRARARWTSSRLARARDAPRSRFDGSRRSPGWMPLLPTRPHKPAGVAARLRRLADWPAHTRRDA